MANVENVDIKDWNKDGTIVKVSNVTFDDGTEAPGYDLPPGIEVGKPLPQGWEVAQSKAGKPYIKVPKSGKGGGFGGPPAYRNTKEGQREEQRSMNARTAIMQADDIDAAQVIYDWLESKVAGAGEAAPSRNAPAPAPTPQQKDEGQPSDAEGDAQTGWAKALGEGASPPGTCLHEEVTTLKPDGKSVMPKGKVRCVLCGLSIKEAVDA